MNIRHKWHAETLDELKEIISRFYKSNGRAPSVSDYRERDELPSYTCAGDLARAAGVKLTDIYAEIDYINCPKPSVRCYDLYKDEYVKLIIKKGVRPNIYKIWEENPKLPRPDWLLRHCPSPSVKKFSDWYDWVGIPRRQMTKEEAIERIYLMANSKDAPLMYDDFRGTKIDEVSIGIIKKYWGTVNKMKSELGLEINQERMDIRHQTFSQIKDNIKTVCAEVKEQEGRDTITGSDFNSRDYSLNAGTINVKLQEFLGCTLSDYVKSIGYDYVKPGNGLVHKYKDGEVTTSRYEYIFSNYLDGFGLKYNKDYYRNVKYCSFISDYDGKMDCDYVIKYNGRTIHIEIAGVLESFKTWYLERKQIINQRFKEKYRKDLLFKEKMLIKSGVEYFILFPCDMSSEIFREILIGDYSDIKNRLNSFYKNNIEWTNVDLDNGVKYDFSQFGKDGQPIVIY